VFFFEKHVVNYLSVVAQEKRIKSLYKFAGKSLQKVCYQLTVEAILNNFFYSSKLVLIQQALKI